MVVCKKFIKILVVSCLILITFLAFSFIFNRYKIKPTENEVVELKKFYKSLMVINCQQEIIDLQNFTINNIKHGSIGIDKIDIIKVIKMKKGMCFDRSMVMQKVMTYNGIDVRPVFLYSNQLKKTTSIFDLFSSKINSHNIFEYKWNDKWYVMETNQLMKKQITLGEFLAQQNIFKTEPRFFRYLNNRNGRFIQPSWIPDIY